MRVWRYDPAKDALPEGTHARDLDRRRVVFVAAPDGSSQAQAWIAVDDYDDTEGTLLFGAPPGDGYPAYVAALVAAAVHEARSIGYATVLAHWRAGWSAAEQVLLESGFYAAAPGIWRRAV